ncbi:MAG: kelch repeat-containing protein [Myxococcaceae bacterium]|nr:kelch repeat-containing protein [Myxococcaceae bacterium]
MEPDAGADAGQATTDGGSLDGGTDAGVVVPVGWARTTGTPGPDGLWGTMLAFDPVDRRFILHGGHRVPGRIQNETWSFSIASATWTKLATTGPMMPFRYCHCTAYLPSTRQVLVAGGRNSGANVDSAFTLDLATLEWQPVMGPVPTGAIGCLAHWVPSLNRAIVFGGDGPRGVNDRTWAYDPATRAFTELMPATRAAARRDPMSVFEPATGRILAFGGSTQIMQSYLDDVVTFDGTTWTTHAQMGTRPSPRRYGASGWDARRGRWMLFGGTNDADDRNDLWLVDPATFTFEQQSTPNGPSARGFAASGVDEVTGTLYIFGGFAGGTTPLNDGWTLRLP